jgi:hypothetical protein
MIREIGSYRFPGFYESIFCNSDEFWDYEHEMKFEIEELISSKNFEVCYEYEDFNKYKLDVGKKYMECYVEKLLEVLPDDITEHENFVFEIIKDTNSVTSPKYYNYDTDHCWCEIKTNRKTLKLIKEYTLRLDGVQKYLRDHFTSRDGFISFIPNGIDIWKETDIEDYEENMLIALLDMLISLSDYTAFDNIKYDTFYNVDKYCYVYPVVYCGKTMSQEDINILKENHYEIKTVDWI